MTHFQNSGFLPPDVARWVEAELQSGERVVWSGQPIASRFARRSMGAVLLGIPWTALAIFWMAMAIGFKMPDFSHGFDLSPLFGPLLIGVPFVLAGFGMLSSPYWMMRKARKTAYIITDRRAIVLAGGPRGSTVIRSFVPDRLKDIRLVQKADGTGDIIFERTWALDDHGMQTSRTDHGFLAIADVRSIEQTIFRLTQET